jgi:hypothetical protein
MWGWCGQLNNAMNKRAAACNARNLFASARYNLVHNQHTCTTSTHDALQQLQPRQVAGCLLQPAPSPCLFCTFPAASACLLSAGSHAAAQQAAQPLGWKTCTLAKQQQQQQRLVKSLESHPHHWQHVLCFRPQHQCCSMPAALHQLDISAQQHTPLQSKGRSAT